MQTIPAPLPSTIKGSAVFPRQSEYLVNLIRAPWGLISRPALTEVAAKAGQPRGLFVWADQLFSVFDNTLYRGLDLAPVGSLGGAQDIDVALGFTQCAIATGSGGYVLGTDLNLSAISDPDLPAVKSVTRVRNRFVWVPTDGESLIFSEVGDAGNIGTLSRFDAESYPDRNVAVETIRNDLFAFNEESIERFRDLGSADAPFVPVDNAVISVGYVGGKVLTQDSVLFLGKDKDAGYAFFVIQDGVSQPISNDAINERLNLDYTRTELESVRAQRFNWRGLDCYAFSLPDRTYVFASGNWCYFDEGIRAPTVIGNFPYYHAVLLGHVWYLQSQHGLFRLDTTHADSRGPFARQFTTYARAPDKKRMAVSYIELENLQGVSAGQGSVGLSLSQNNRTWSPPFFRELATIGRYTDRLRWQSVGGLGRFEGLVGINIYTTDALEFAADNMLLAVSA